MTPCEPEGGQPATLTIDQIKALCAKDLAIIDLIDQELTRKPGGANNPEGIGGKSHKEAIVNHDNIMNDKETKATQGTSIEYTLRRLRPCYVLSPQNCCPGNG